MFTFYSPSREIAGIKLNTRFVGIYFQSTSAFGVVHFSYNLADVALGVQNVVVVVAVTVFNCSKS